MVITVEKLVKPIHEGDWHDKPFNWTVKGPSSEVQHFGTKKNASTYAQIRRASSSLAEASKRYAKECEFGVM